MQQDNSFNYVMQAVQQELNAMVSNNNSFLVQKYVSDLTANSYLNNYMHELVTFCNIIYLRTCATNANVTVYQVVADLFRGQLNLGYLHMAQWLMVTGLWSEIPPKNIDSIKQQAATFYNMAVNLGIYNNQQQQQSQYRQPQFTQGFKPQLSNDLSQHGFNNNNVNFSNSNTSQPTQRVSYRAGNVTTVNQNAPTNGNTPHVQTNTTAEPVATPRSNTPNVEPPKSDIKLWLEYHYERLSKLGIKGPDYASSRPYDVMLLDDLNADGESGDLWVLANTIEDVKPTFIYGKPQYNVYSPDIRVRYLVFNFDKGCIREGFLMIDEHPDMAYAALEQGAKPIKKTKSIGDLYTNMMKGSAPKVDVIDPDSIESIVDDEPEHVSVSDEVKLLLSKTKELLEGVVMETAYNVILCDSVETGEMKLDLEGGSTGTSSFVVCKPFVVQHPREVEMIERFSACSSLNDVKLVFDSYDPKDVEIARVYREFDERFTEIVSHITWNEYRIKPVSVASDLGALLNVIREDFGNDSLANFIKETRNVIDTATLMLTAGALLTYKEERVVGGNNTEAQLMVFGKMHIVNNIDVYSNQLTFKLDSNPVTFNLLTLDSSDPTQTVVKSINDIFSEIVDKMEDPNSVVYLRTKDNKRIRLSYGMTDRNQLHMSVL